MRDIAARASGALLLLLASFAPPSLAQSARAQRLEDFDTFQRAIERTYAYPEALGAWRAGIAQWRKRAREARDDDAFVGALEGALDLLRDDGATLSRRTRHSPRRVPQEADAWARFVDGTARIEAVRVASDADVAGLQPGVSVVRIEGVDVARAVAARLGADRDDPAARDWALRHLLAGPRRGAFTLQLADGREVVLDHERAERSPPAALARRMGEARDVGYLRLRFEAAPSVARQLEEGLAALRGMRALMLDLRDTSGPRDAHEMQAVLARFARATGPWRVRVARSGARTEDRVARAHDVVAVPLVVLVDRWTEGPAESLAVGLRAVAGATLVGTAMAQVRGVPGAVRLRHSGIVVRFAVERAYAPDGTLREDARPDVPVDLAAPSGGPGDPILYQALKRLEKR